MSTLREQLSDVMRRFDFTRVQRAMVALDWRWAIGCDGVTPDINRLKSTAYQLLDCAVTAFEGLDVEDKKYGYSAATGGFEARVESFKEGDPRLELLFYVEQRGGQNF